MEKIAGRIFLALMAVALGALLFVVAYAATDWYRTGSHFLFDSINADPRPVFGYAWTDLKAGRFAKLQYAGAAALFGFVLPLAVAFFMRPPKRNDAKFMSMADVRRAGLLKPRGIFIGRAGGRLANVFAPHRDRRTGKLRLTRPKVRGGKKLWIDGDDVGGFVIGPPRSGKGAALIIPNALMWPHSLVVLDLRGETYEATAGYRATFSQVVRFAPADRDGNTAFYNPMDFISLDSAQRDIDLRNMAAALFPRPPANADPYWVNDARLLFTGIASYVMESPQIADENRSFATILRIMNGADEPILEFLASLRDTRRQEVSNFTLQTLLPYADMAEKQFSGLYAGVRTGMAPFLNERLMRATARSSFDIRNLKSKRVSLYLDFRREQMASLGPLFNVLITQMMNFMSESMPRPGEHQVLVLLDEFQNLGKLENVTDMATVLGGHGVPMWFFVQSLKSIDEIYRKESRETLINAARVQIFFGAQETDDLRYVSEQIGETSEPQKDVTRTQASLFDTYYTRSVHSKQVRRPLMRPDEIRTMDKSKVVILPRGENAILATRNFYFADRELSKRAFMVLPERTDAKGTKPVAAPAALPSRPVQSIVPVGPRYRSGITRSRLQRGATFAAKVGRAEPPVARRRLSASQKAAGIEASHIPSAAAPVASQAVDFSALAARAAATRISPQKEAMIAAILAEAKSFRPQSADAETFDRNLSVVAEALPDVVDE
ncbi:hypothetical protein EN745_02835 [Mesorhizobium sp. M4A.F.Ca.ET.022.05.2.1]|uniref:type IV secretory system conjugative DNA transfer family protein n=1 Tax=Mesorhizobium sp. M4A.F.Ca.ET.022.05.2.1 TaxID=2496653 RepID=UPI000FCA9BC2|nr:type IV secretory system conjugative DNA transfer family protein [Mesorhizobium sp. M4A.F.Ca.ET.022.05.2.1]RVC83443.1 hypothetical protein EN745_02835 [Mesorhizobium sp. M4A.F.Ca.ET.022.05.2.1]TIW61364.1 MAG: hypothetical protein E5V48_09645 [Mesorhizobium sp.]